MTLAEFLEWDDGTDRRYELFHGVPVTMAPPLEAHSELVMSLGAEIRSRLRSPCRVLSEAGLLIPDHADTFYIADLAITCALREPGRRHVVDPVVIVEVLSPSTGGIDRRRKVMDYRQIPSVQAILLVAAEAQHVEVQRRTPSGCMVDDLIGRAELGLDVCTNPIPLDAIYGDLLAGEAAGAG
jgi:Uma2 family endonuclease